MTTPSRYVPAFGLSAALTSLFSAALVLLKETNEGVMAWMKAATGHHWVTHGIVILILFLALGLALARFPPRRRAGDLNGVAVSIVVSTVISGLIIAGAFLMG